MDPLCKFWFSNPNLWFNSTPETDEIVSKMVEKIDFERLSILGKIIYYDQCVRHLIRYHDDDPKLIEPNREIGQKIMENAPLDYQETLAPIQKTFFWMPLRHSPREIDRQKALELVLEALNSDQPDKDYLRFYRATLVRMRDPEWIIYNPKIPFPLELLCPNCWFCFENLMFQQPNIPKEIIESLEQIHPDKTVPITISISGGSDSMLLLYLAKKLGYQLQALMIDYCNREEHLKEVQLVSWFCNLFKVPFYVRKIPELKRHHGQQNLKKHQSREFYEGVTQEIRFKSYQTLGTPVALGHNLDDCFENGLTNTLMDRNLDNLSGMRKIETIKKVIILRPLLSIPKSQIVHLCNQYGIPFLVDSTPKWSRRGQIRDHIVPALNNFDQKLIPKMMGLFHKMSDMEQEYQQVVQLIPIQFNQSSCSFRNPKIYTFNFWKAFIKRISDHYRLRIPTACSIRNLLDFLQRNEIRRKNLQMSLSRDMKLILPANFSGITIQILDN